MDLKQTFWARLPIGFFTALCLLATACGNGEETGSTLPTPTATVVEATQPPTHDHDHHSQGDHHHHDTPMEVGYEPVPTIELRTHLDPQSGVNLEVITTGFELAPERASTEPIDGEGHFHIYVDGEKLRRLYAHWAHIDLKEPGDYEIRVELSANNHAPLAVDGKRLDATAVVTIPSTAGTTEPTTGTSSDDAEPTTGTSSDDAEPTTGTSSDDAEPTAEVDGTTIEVEVVGGKPVDGIQRHRIDAGDTVTVIVQGDTVDELHIHGYDLEVGFAPDRPGTITFEANIPGIFEAETHHHGYLVMELEVR